MLENLKYSQASHNIAEDNFLQHQSNIFLLNTAYCWSCYILYCPHFPFPRDIIDDVLILSTSLFLATYHHLLVPEITTFRQEHKLKLLERWEETIEICIINNLDIICRLDVLLHV